MKKLLLSFAALSFLALVSAPAMAADTPFPPCDTTIRQMQEDHANLMRSRDRAYVQEMTKKPESTIDLTCLDQALQLTSLLSNLFSAIKLDVSIQPNTGVFCGFTYPTQPNISLSGRLKDLLGAWKPNWLNLLPAYAFNICTPPMNYKLPHLSMGGGLGGCLPNMNLGGGTLSPFKPQCIGIQTPGNMNCNAIKDAWKGTEQSVEGKGRIAGVPYLSVQDLVKINDNSSNFANVGEQFKKQMGNNSAILDRAMDNLIKLEGPGNIPSWPTVPHFSANTNTQDVINSM